MRGLPSGVSAKVTRRTMNRPAFRGIENTGAVGRSRRLRGRVRAPDCLSSREPERTLWFRPLPGHRRRRFARACRQRCQECRSVLDASAASHHGVRDEPVQDSPAPASKRTLPSSFWPLCWSMPCTAIFNARPGQPVSATTRLLPPPRANTGKISRMRESNRLLHFLDVTGLGEISRRPSDFDGGQRCERNVFKQQHESFSIYTGWEQGAPAHGITEVRPCSGFWQAAAGCKLRLSYRWTSASSRPC